MSSGIFLNGGDHLSPKRQQKHFSRTAPCCAFWHSDQHLFYFLFVLVEIHTFKMDRMTKHSASNLLFSANRHFISGFESRAHNGFIIRVFSLCGTLTLSCHPCDRRALPGRKGDTWCHPDGPVPSPRPNSEPTPHPPLCCRRSRGPERVPRRAEQRAFRGKRMGPGQAPFCF